MAFTKLAGGNTRGKVMTMKSNARCQHLNSALLEHYELAIKKYTHLLEELNCHMAYGAPFGDRFRANFDRG